MTNKRKEIRDNMLVTIGVRAGHMDSAGHLAIGGSVYDEESFAKFATSVVDEYLATDSDTPFDEHIETALTEKYGKAKVCAECAHWKPHGLKHGRGVGDCKGRGTEEFCDAIACENFKEPV